MLLLRGELRKVMSFKSKDEREFYKLKVELEHFDVEVFVAPKLYERIEELKSMIAQKIEFPVFLKCKVSEDGTKVYQNYSVAEMPVKL
ncbi:hypothetical protein AB6C49_18610 [Vibrio cyclitrophicus]